MRTHAEPEKLTVYENELASGVSRFAEAVKSVTLLRLLEVTVWVLVAVWGLQMFGLWVKFLKWGTLLQFPQ